MKAKDMHAVRFPADTLAQVEELARLWGPVVPLSFSHVVREAVRRCHQAEKKNRKNPR